MEQEALNSTGKTLEEDDVQIEEVNEEEEKHDKAVKSRKIIIMLILIGINLLNYMDRFTVAGVLTNVQAFFGLNNSEGGLMQSIFMICFMFCSPVFGFFGDRYTRKWLIAGGMSLWISAVFASSFVPREMFWLFLLLRGVVGIGEASYSTIAPSVISDMFAGQSRSRMLMVFSFAIPCGSGLGFITGSRIAALAGHWTWGVRFTVILGVISLILTIIYVQEPYRGAAEKARGDIAISTTATAYLEDLNDLFTNRTYILGTAGYTAIVFAVGTLSWWGPTTLMHSEAHKLGLNDTDMLDSEEKAHINLIFGVLSCVGGIVGVGVGSVLSMMLRSGYGPFKRLQTTRSDPIICGVGALLAVPTLFFSFYFVPRNMSVAWVLMFIAITACCFNWAIIVDMVMAVVIPPRRNTAMSWQILLSHLFGDASGPYIVGMISDAIRKNDSSPFGNFDSLVTSFYLPNVLLIVSAVLLFCAALTFVEDNTNFKKAVGVLENSLDPDENTASPQEESSLPEAEEQ